MSSITFPELHNIIINKAQNRNVSLSIETSIENLNPTGLYFQSKLTSALHALTNLIIHAKTGMINQYNNSNSEPNTFYYIEQHTWKYIYENLRDIYWGYEEYNSKIQENVVETAQGNLEYRINKQTGEMTIMGKCNIFDGSDYEPNMSSINYESNLFVPAEIMITLEQMEQEYNEWSVKTFKY